MPLLNPSRFGLLLILMLSGCTLSPKSLRQSLDTCTEYQFQSLVYRRQVDGAVTRVLCVPREDEVGQQVYYWLPLGWLSPFRREGG